MDGCHGLDLLDLRFQGDAPVGLLVCRNPHVTDPFCFHSQPFQHAKTCRHKLSGYRFRPTSVWETPGEDQPRLRPAKHTDGSHRLPPRSPEGRGGVAGFAVSRWCWWAAVRGNHAYRGFRLWAGGSGECAQTPHTGKVQQGRAATPATPATTFSPTKKRGGKLSGSSSRALPSMGPGSFLRSALPRNAAGPSVGWRRLAPRRAEASTRSQRQRRQLVHRNLAAVLVIRGGWSGCFGTDAPCSLRYAYHKEKTMTNRLLLGTLLLFAGTGFAAQTWTGKISDSDCGAKHKSAAEHGGKAMSDHDCAVACVKGGAKYVFVTGGKVYPINNQDFSGLEEHAGHTVKLTGDMQSQGGINVTGVQMTSAKKK